MGTVVFFNLIFAVVIGCLFVVVVFFIIARQPLKNWPHIFISISSFISEA